MVRREISIVETNSVSVSKTIVKTPIYHIFWQDEQQTICVVQALTKSWDWGQALTAIQTVDAAVRSVSHGVYVIYWFEAHNSILPRDGSLIMNLRKLMSYHAPNTHLVVFVRADPTLITFSHIVINAFKIINRKYVFVNSMEQAQQLIAEARETFKPTSEA
jgi:hypothetical protein